MSTVESPSGPRTIQVPGNGGGILDFTLPPGITLDLESVLVVVDTTLAGPTVAELVIAEQSGVVIATKRQSEALDPLLFGTATWALRLDDDGGAAAPVATTKYEAFSPAGATQNTINSISTLPFVHLFGDVLGSFAGGFYTIAAAGTYALSLNVQGDSQIAGYFTFAEVEMSSGATVQRLRASAAWQTVTLGGSYGPTFAITRKFVAGDTLRVRVSTTFSGTTFHRMAGGLAKLA